MVSQNATGAPFGETTNGTTAHIYTLLNSDLRVAITDYGGRIVSIETGDGAGRWRHVVLGFDAVPPYERNPHTPFGPLLGRTANRIGGAQFQLEGRTYQLPQNEGSTTLHGGPSGFDKKFWQVTEIGADRVELTLTSAAGDQGYPGQLTVAARYRLERHTLWLEFTARTNEPTPVSLSAHPYFNLGGPEASVFSIMRSRLSPTGSCRRMINRFPLAKSGTWSTRHSTSAGRSRRAREFARRTRKYSSAKATTIISCSGAEIRRSRG